MCEAPSGPFRQKVPDPFFLPSAWTFVIPSVDCRRLKVAVIDGDKPHIGITEIEVYGDGPTESTERGLIRSKPHVQTIERPGAQTAAGSVLLSGGGKSTIELSGDRLTAGSGAMLLDGDRTNVVRVDKGAHQHFSLTAEIDLGQAFLIDAVNVWMPGGKGTANGHVHDLTLAISPSADGTDWQTPVELITNPYWPGDEAPQPYVIPVSRLNVVGRRVRITATLMGTGGVTNRLGMAEIEVWGSPAKAAIPPAATLEFRPIQIDPEPVGELHPKLRWMGKRKVRAAWIGDDLFDKFPGIDKTKAEVLTEAGFNLVRVSMGVDRKDRNTSPDLAKRLPANVEEAHRVGIPLLIGWQYGSTHQEPYRKYRSGSGHLHERTCCPLDGQYIERHFGRWAVAVASGGADGIVIDTEMYESDETGYAGPCVCDDCFATYLKAFVEQEQWKRLYEQVPAERRGLWLSANRADAHYSRFTAKRVEAQYDEIRQRCQAVNPAFLFGHAPFLGHVGGMERGLGTSSAPCLVLSEMEYGRGPSGRSYANVRRVREEGIPALYLCGLFLVQQTPDMVKNNALISSLYCDGWWLYYASAVLNHPDDDDPEAFRHSYGRVKGTSARDYLDRIATMHHRLDELLGKPRDQWPKPE